MRFEKLAVSDAVGSILLRNVAGASGKRILKKGVVLTTKHAGRLAEAGCRVPAVEVMRATPYIRDCIENKEKTKLIHAAIAAGTSQYGMQTFDQALFDLYEQSIISYEEAMRNADSKNELRLRVKLESKRDSSIADQQSESLRIIEEDTAQTF